MAAIAWDGLHSCVESHLVESSELNVSFTFSKSHLAHQNSIDLPIKTSLWDSNKESHESDKGLLSFLQALSMESTEKKSVYVHPQEKISSSSKMSQKSLDLCTEELGNENGSDDIVDSDAFEDFNMMCSRPTTREKKQAMRKTRTHDFPPPLLTMRGSEYLRVKRKYEDGRLVMEATWVPPSASFFQVERCHGRLRLCFLKNNEEKFEPEETDEESEDDNVGVEEECQVTMKMVKEIRKQVETCK